MLPGGGRRSRRVRSSRPGPPRCCGAARRPAAGSRCRERPGRPARERARRGRGSRGATRSGERASSRGAMASKAVSVGLAIARGEAARGPTGRGGPHWRRGTRATTSGSCAVWPRRSPYAYSPVKKKRTSSRADAYPPRTTTVATRPLTRGSAAARSAGPAPTLTATRVAGPGRRSRAAITGSVSWGRSRPCVSPGMVGTATAKPVRARRVAAAKTRSSRLPWGANPWTSTSGALSRDPLTSIDVGGRQGQVPPPGCVGQAREDRIAALGQEFHEESARQGQAGSGDDRRARRGRRREREARARSRAERGGCYLRLMHFTRRQPWNMLTLTMTPARGPPARGAGEGRDWISSRATDRRALPGPLASP